MSQTRRKVFTGTLSLDSLNLSREEINQKIFDTMELAGLEVGDRENLEIVFEGANDNDGVSETQTSEYTVYRILAEKEQAELLREDDLSDLLQELKELREKLESSESVNERRALIEQIAKRTEVLEKTAADARAMDEALKNELRALEEQIIAYQRDIKMAAIEYEASYKRLQAILEEQAGRLETSELLSEEELNTLREFYAEKKLEENEKSVSIKKQIEEQKRLLITLKRRKNKLEKQIHTAEALGLSVSELREVISTVNKRKILNAIFKKKGLEAIVAKKASDRTKEEKLILKEAREEIIKEISELRAQDKSISVEDAIESLYSVSVEYKEVEPPKELLIRERQLKNIRRHASMIPEKIINPKQSVKEKVEEEKAPLEKPVDLVDVEEGVHSVVVEEEDRKEVVERVTFFKDVDNNGQLYVREYALRRFHFIPLTSDSVMIDDITCYPVDALHAEYVMNHGNNGYSPYQVNVEEVHLGKMDSASNEAIVKEVIEKEEKEEKKNRDIQERIIVYHDLDKGYQLVNKYAATRFNLVPVSLEPVRIDGLPFYRIYDRDAKFIKNHGNNDYSPYIVDTRDIHLGKEIPIVKKEDVVPPKEITIFRDTVNNNEAYVDKYTLNRFDLIPIGEEVKIEGKTCYKVDNEDIARIVGRGDNKFSPYVVKAKDVELPKRMVLPVEDEQEEVITFYRNSEDRKKIYVNAHILLRYGINPSSKVIRINGINSYQISDDDYKKICEDARAKKGSNVSIRFEEIRVIKKEAPKTIDIVPKSEEPAKVVEPPKPVLKEPEKVEIRTPRKEKLSIDSIVERVTKGLIPTDGEASTYKPIHLKASSKFIHELQTGEWVYNIIHAVPEAGKTTYEFLERLSNQLVSSGKANESLNELARRLRDDLSEEEVNALFREYKDSDLKNHLNNPVNLVVVERLKNFGLDHIQRIHLQLQRQYTGLYSLLGQIKSLEEKIGSGKLSENDRYAYLSARRQYVGRAASMIKKIEEERKAVNIILTSGIPGIESGYDKDSYPLVERGNVTPEQFDSELKERYYEYRQELDGALEKNDPELILSGFMGVESCSFRQNDVARSMVGRKSVGTKYFSSFAREFYYQDDAFAKDLFTMVADSVAVVGSYYQNFNASNFEAFRYYQDVMGRYGKGMLSPERVVSDIKRIAQDSYDNLERVVDESSSIIDVSEIRANLGSLILNPSDILNLPAMNSLPKDDRDRLLFAFASCTFAVQVATLMDHKYASLSARDMVRESAEILDDKAKVH